MSITEKLQARPLRQSRVKTKSQNENRLELGSAQLPKTKSRCRAAASERCGCQRLGMGWVQLFLRRTGNIYLGLEAAASIGQLGMLEDIIKKIV